MGREGRRLPPARRQEAAAALWDGRRALTSCSAWYSRTVMFLWKPPAPAPPSTPRLVITMGCSTRKLTLTTRSSEEPEGASSGNVKASISWFRTGEGAGGEETSSLAAVRGSPDDSQVTVCHGPLPTGKAFQTLPKHGCSQGTIILKFNGQVFSTIK